MIARFLFVILASLFCVGEAIAQLAVDADADSSPNVITLDIGDLNVTLNATITNPPSPQRAFWRKVTPGGPSVAISYDTNHWDFEEGNFSDFCGNTSEPPTSCSGGTVDGCYDGDEGPPTCPNQVSTLYESFSGLYAWHATCPHPKVLERDTAPKLLRWGESSTLAPGSIFTFWAFMPTHYTEIEAVSLWGGRTDNINFFQFKQANPGGTDFVWNLQLEPNSARTFAKFSVRGSSGSGATYSTCGTEADCEMRKNEWQHFAVYAEGDTSTNIRVWKDGNYILGDTGVNLLANATGTSNSTNFMYGVGNYGDDCQGFDDFPGGNGLGSYIAFDDVRAFPVSAFTEDATLTFSEQPALPVVMELVVSNEDGSTVVSDYVEIRWAADADGDGVPDTDDNCRDVANVDQTDADSDGYGCACDWDTDQDNIVGTPDFGPILMNFGAAATGGAASADTNCDNIVGTPDFGPILMNFGSSVGPSDCAPTCPPL